MIKSPETINEAVRNPKHPFNKLGTHPDKARKRRHERRRIKEFLHLGEWEGESSAEA